MTNIRRWAHALLLGGSVAFAQTTPPATSASPTPAAASPVQAQSAPATPSTQRASSSVQAPAAPPSHAAAGAQAAAPAAPATAIAAPASPAVVPLEAFAVLPDQPPLISPDGTHYAMIRSLEGRPVVYVQRIGGAEPPHVYTAAEWLIDSLLWAKNDTLLIYSRKNAPLRFRGDDVLVVQNRAISVSLGGGTPVPIFDGMSIRDIALDDADNIYTQFAGNLYRVNVHASQSPQQVMAGDFNRTWFLDGHGKPLAAVDAVVGRSWRNPNWSTVLKVRENDDWRELHRYEGGIDKSDGIAGVSEDGLAVIRIATEGPGPSRVVRVALADGTENPLFSDPYYDVGELILDAWTQRVIGVAVDRETMTYHYFDRKRQALQNGLEKAFPGLSVHAVSAEVSQNRVIVQAEGPRTPPTYYLLDRTTHEASEIIASYPGIAEAKLGDIRPYHYQARDGWTVPAYLVLPPGREPKNLPLIVMPHGGPEVRDDTRFDWWAQFLASRGYAVLKPNFRGSTGYGRVFEEAGLKQWGLKMQDDVSDGVAKVIADGIADPKRICIVGASYGGYAALAGAAFTPNLYACAISYAGISDLAQSVKSERSDAARLFWSTRIGDPDDDEDRLDATSPAKHADRVTAPVLLLHSELDITVPIEQSEIMERAMKKAGKKVEFVRLPGDDHYLSLASTRLRLLTEIERFLKENIGG